MRVFHVERSSMSLPVALAAFLVPLISSGAAAQEIPPGPLTLDQVLLAAEARSEAIAIAQQGIRRAEGDEIRARSGLRPQLSAAASYDRALASEFSGVFDNLDFGGSDGSGDGLSNLPFGRKNTWRATLSFSQSLYSGGRVEAQQALAAAGTDTAGLALTSARAQLLLEVTQAYYDAALSDRLVAIAEATLGQATATLQQTEVAFRAGTQPEFEVLRARVSRDTQHPQIIRQRVNREVALLRLRQMLDLPLDYDLRLAAALSDETLPPAPVFASRLAAIESSAQAADPVQVMPPATVPAADRTAVKEVATGVRLREAALEAVRAQRMPAVSLTSNYSRIAYPSGALPTFNRSNWTVGVMMQLPVLTGGRQRGDELVAAADLEQAQIRLRQVEELAALDTRSAWAELVAARAAWEATAGTVQQATRAYEIAEVRYQAGVSTQLELSDSRLLLQQAEANRAQAARDLQVARARMALLPDLPLGVGGTGQGGVPPSSAPTQAPAFPQSQPPGSGSQMLNAAVQSGTQSFGGGE